MARIHKSTSPYFNTPIKDFYLDLWKKREVPENANDKLLVIEPKYEGRPDLLSSDLYGTPRLWWVFAVRNMDILVDPVEDMKAGVDIFVPAKETVGELI